MLALKHWQIEASRPLAPSNDDVAEAIRYEDSGGPLVITRRMTSAGDCFRLHHGLDLLVEVRPDRRIVPMARAGLPTHTLDHFIRDQVAPRVVAHEGKFVIHAAGIRVADGAMLLVGTTGRGKSTLAASFHQSGNALLGDDAMIIDCAGARSTARAVYPSLRLLPDSIAALYSGAVESSAIAHYSAKQRIALPDAADFPPLPIHAIFVLAQPTSSGISIQPMKPSHACIAMVENSFALDPADLTLAAERLRTATQLVARLPVFEVAYPRAFACLPEVRAALLEQLQITECEAPA